MIRESSYFFHCLSTRPLRDHGTVVRGMMRREKLGKPLLILGLANITISQVMMVFDCAEGIARTNIKLKRELASIFQALSTQNKGEIARLRKDMEPTLMTKDERE